MPPDITKVALPIPMTQCSSSQIESTGYDPTIKTLAIQFRKKGGSGSIYYYGNVTPEIAEEFSKAESKGKFFGERIKGQACFDCRKLVLDDEQEAA